MTFRLAFPSLAPCQHRIDRGVPCQGQCQATRQLSPQAGTKQNSRRAEVRHGGGSPSAPSQDPEEGNEECSTQSLSKPISTLSRCTGLSRPKPPLSNTPRLLRPLNFEAASVKTRLNLWLSRAMVFAGKSGWQLTPLPTAVPPRGSLSILVSPDCIPSPHSSS